MLHLADIAPTRMRVATSAEIHVIIDGVILGKRNMVGHFLATVTIVSMLVAPNVE